MYAVVVVVGAWDVACCHPSAGVGAADAEDKILMTMSDTKHRGNICSFLRSMNVGLQIRS